MRGPAGGWPEQKAAEATTAGRAARTATGVCRIRGPAGGWPEQTAGGLRGAKPPGLGVRGLPPGIHMRVDVRPVSRLRGPDPVSVITAIGPVIDALCAGTADLSRLSVVCDWIQYRSSFREVADFRPVLATAAVPDQDPGSEAERD